MNIYRLNLKMRMIMEAHDIINRDYFEAIQNIKLGISEEYLYNKIISGFDVDQIEIQITQFVNLMKKYSIRPLFFLSQKSSNKLNRQLVLETILQQNKEINYNGNFRDQIIPKRIIIKILNDLGAEYIVTIDPGSQLKYYYISNLIIGILGEISFLKNCHSFKELNHLMFNVIEDTFEWVDIKILTSKLQLSLDSLAELYQVWDYCSQDTLNIYNESILDTQSKNRFEKTFANLTTREQTDILYVISQQIFAGKYQSLDARLQKFQTHIKDINPILNYLKKIGSAPYVDQNGDYMCLEGPQYPTEINIFNIFGIGIKRTFESLAPSLELGELTLNSAEGIVLEKLNLGYLQGKNIKLPQMINNNFYKDAIKEPSMARSLSFYYKKLKLTSRKNSVEESELQQVINQETLQLNTYLRFFHYFDFINMNKEKGSLFASALFIAKQQYIQEIFMYLYIMGSQNQHCLMYQFYDYYFVFDQLQLNKLLKENNKEFLKDKYKRDPYVTHQQISQPAIILIRAFIIFNKRKLVEFNQFTDLLNTINNYFAEVYDNIVIGLHLDMNQRNLLEACLIVGKENPFNRQYYYQKDILQFFTKQMKKEDFKVNYDIDAFVNFWQELIKVLQYLNNKQEMPIQKILQADDYLQQLLL